MINKTLNLLRIAAQKRQVFESSTNAMRLVNGIGDGLDGLVLEQYNRHFVVQIFNEKWFLEKETLVSFVKEKCSGEYLIVKDRTGSASSKKQSKISFSHSQECENDIASSVKNGFKSEVWIDSGNSKTIVEENGLKFGVDLNDGLNSGLFLDMRYNRKLVGELARGRNVLNCFAYTCSFGVYCRAARASEVANVDISQKSLNRGGTNYELNKIVPAENEFIRADAVEYLQRAVKKDNRFDLIILDPPSFATYQGKNFSVKKDLAHLVDLAIKALNPDGFLFIATNFSNLSYKNLDSMVKSGAGQRRVKNIQHLSQDADFVGSGLTRESYLTAVLVEMDGN